MDTHEQNHEDDIGAAASNLIALRLTQVGRSFMTAEDHRVMRTLTAIVMMIRDVPASEHLGRSQTLPAYPRTNAFRSIESAVNAVAASLDPPQAATPVQTPPQAIQSDDPPASDAELETDLPILRPAKDPYDEIRAMAGKLAPRQEV